MDEEDKTDLITCLFSHIIPIPHKYWNWYRYQQYLIMGIGIGIVSAKNGIATSLLVDIFLYNIFFSVLLQLIYQIDIFICSFVWTTMLALPLHLVFAEVNYNNYQNINVYKTEFLLIDVWFLESSYWLIWSKPNQTHTTFFHWR